MSSSLVRECIGYGFVFVFLKRNLRTFIKSAGEKKKERKEE